MEIFAYLIIFFSFVLSIIALVGAACIWVQNMGLQKSWLERIAEIDAERAGMEEKQDLLKKTLEQVHKVHLERQADLNPLIDRITGLEVRTTALAANQRRPG